MTRRVLLILIAISLLAVIIQKSISLLPSTKNLPISSLNNSLVQKVAEKLPIPKITMLPVTPFPEEASVSANPFPSSWKIYKNTIYNFSLNYPAELTVQENNHEPKIADISFNNPTSNPRANPKYQIIIFPKTLGSLIGQDFNEFYNLPSGSARLLTVNGVSPQQFIKIRNTKINNMRAFDFKAASNPPDPNEETETGTCIELGENILLISTKESNEAILNQMLLNFKYPL